MMMQKAAVSKKTTAGIIAAPNSQQKLNYTPQYPKHGQQRMTLST